MTDAEPFQSGVTPEWGLIGCALVNRARWSVAKPILAAIAARWPDVALLSAVPESEIEPIVAPLGFRKSRARAVVEIGRAVASCRGLGIRMTRAIVMEIPGCGRYASDSWAIFAEGNMKVRPTDRVLRAYLERMRESSGC